MSRSVSILTGGSNSHATAAADFNGVMTDFIAQGVVGALTNTAGVAPSTGGMAVNAQGTPNTTVQINPGIAYVTGTPTGSTSQTFRCVDPDGATITHAANATGGTRFDWIYVTIDATKLANPAVDASDVFTYTVSRSTSGTVDNGTPPTYGYNIAVTTLANGFASVVNANIADRRARTGANSVASNANITGTPVGSSAIDWSTFALNMKTATNSGTLSPTNTDQDLASSGLSISFTVATACNALVTVAIGVASAADFEYRPEIRLGGTQVAIFSPAAGLGNSRAHGRTFTAVIPLAAGANVLSIGLFLASGSAYTVSPGGAVISALVLGKVTA